MAIITKHESVSSYESFLAKLASSQLASITSLRPAITQLQYDLTNFDSGDFDQAIVMESLDNLSAELLRISHEPELSALHADANKANVELSLLNIISNISSPSGRRCP